MMPIYLMPFFLALMGLMVLSNEYNFPAIKQNCQFLNHPVGMIVFYLYLAALMSHFSSSLTGVFQIAAQGAGLGYLVLGIMLGVVGCFGEQKVNEKLNNIEEKITKD